MFTKLPQFFVVKLAALLLLAGCSLFSPPDDLDLRVAKPSHAGMYTVSLRPLAEQIDINRIHSWEILVRNPDGSPAKNARIAIDGGMPQHGHGLPTKPRVTGELADGRYRVDGVKFSMTGWWELKFKIDGERGSDHITFNLVLPDGARAASGK